MKKLLEDVKKEMAQLKDEINLQAHLGKAEVRQEFEKLEKKFVGLMVKAKPFTVEVEKTAENTGTALKVAVEELMDGVDRIRKLIK